MKGIALGFLLGVVLLQQVTRLPPAGLSLLLPVVLAAMLRYRRGLFLSALVGGLLWASLWAHARLQPTLARVLEGRDVTLTGTIVSIPTVRGDAYRFVFDVDRDSLQLGFVPGRLRLNWYGDSPAKLKLNQRWRLAGRLKRPWGFSNPGGFDYEGWLFRRGIRATGYVRAPATARLLNDSVAPIYTVGGLRRWIHGRLSNQLRESANTGVLNALAIGERGAVPPAQWNLLVNTGTSHLLAISGLHIGLVAGFVYFLMLGLWRLFPGLSLRWPAPRTAAALSLLAGLGYAVLTGLSIPTQRAVIMLAAVVLATLTDRSRQPANVLSLALLLVLIRDPLSVLSPGFWLSFGAVAIIIWSAAGRRSIYSNSWRLGRLQWMLALALIPLTLLFFSRAVLIAPIANLLAVPWVGFVTVPATLLATLCLPVSDWLSGTLLHIADLSLNLLWAILHTLAALPHADWRHTPPPWTLVPALTGILWLLAPRGWPARPVGAVLVLPVMLAAQPMPRAGDFALTLLDVGQGLSAVVRTRHHTLVYDTGPRFSAYFNAGDAVILPYLRSRNVDKLARLIVSHEDNDHIGGAAAILDSIPVGEVLTSAPLAFQYSPVHACVAGQHWQWDGVNFKILHPPAHWSSQRNDRSCVLRVGNRGGTVLLTGDIEARAEERLIAEQRQAIDTDILLVPHHGSRTSSSSGFLRAVNPRLALVAAGYRNRFGFPSGQVLKRYRQQAIPVVNTAPAGAIRLIIDPGEGIERQPPYRDQTRHYWTTPY